MIITKELVWRQWVTQWKNGRKCSITDATFPSGPSWLCSTSHSRQCAGTLPTAPSQCSSSCMSETAWRCSVSVVSGLTAIHTNKCRLSIVTRGRNGEKSCCKNPFELAPKSRNWTRPTVPWFWICREMNFDLTGPSGDDPFTQMLMSVKIGSESPVKLQPLLTPLQMMYFGHSTAWSSPLCLAEKDRTRWFYWGFGESLDNLDGFPKKQRPHGTLHQNFSRDLKCCSFYDHFHF